MMADWIEVGLLALILLVQVARWVQDDWYRWQKRWFKVRDKIRRQ